MGLIKVTLSDDGTDGGARTAFDRVRTDMETIFGPAADRRPYAIDGGMPDRSRACGAAPDHRTRGPFSESVAGRVVLGCMSVTCLAGALALIGRGDGQTSRLVMKPPAEGAPVATASSASDRPSTVAVGADPSAEAISRSEDLRPSRRDASEGSPAGIVRADPPAPPPVPSAAGSGEAVVRAFYAALGAGDGETASAQVVAEKRSGRAFAPAAISRFYGGLAEPLRLTGIVESAPGVYRVRYRYSAGGSRCDGRAVVRLTRRDGRDFIRSIDAPSGC